MHPDDLVMEGSDPATILWMVLMMGASRFLVTNGKIATDRFEQMLAKLSVDKRSQWDKEHAETYQKILACLAECISVHQVAQNELDEHNRIRTMRNHNDISVWTAHLDASNAVLKLTESKWDTIKKDYDRAKFYSEINLDDEYYPPAKEELERWRSIYDNGNTWQRQIEELKQTIGELEKHIHQHRQGIRKTGAWNTRPVDVIRNDLNAKLTKVCTTYGFHSEWIGVDQFVV